MTTFRLVLLVLTAGCLVGCASEVSVPTSPTPAAAETYSVSGVVSKTVDGISRPVPDRQVHMWIQVSNGGFTRVVATDASGRFTTSLPPGRVFANAWHLPDEQQPCLASAAVNRDTTLDVELLPTDGPSAPPSAAGPLITGFVYESTPQGRKPVGGVHISVDAANDVWVAYTKTDDEGRFFLCRVNAPVQMVVSGNGYQDWWQSIPGTGDMQLEIELRR
jgi:hypothetical protein